MDVLLKLLYFFKFIKRTDHVQYSRSTNGEKEVKEHYENRSLVEQAERVSAKMDLKHTRTHSYESATKQALRQSVP